MLDDGYPLMINGVAVVSAPVEIDIVNAEQLRAVLREAGGGGRARVVVDMTGTRFCDSEGFSVLVGAHKWARAEGGGLRLVIPADSPFCGSSARSAWAASSPGSAAWNRSCLQNLSPPPIERVEQPVQAAQLANAPLIHPWQRIDAIRARVEELRARRQDEADLATPGERLASAQRQMARLAGCRPNGDFQQPPRLPHGSRGARACRAGA